MHERTDGLDALVEAARAGSSDAWSELVVRFQGVALATAFGALGDAEAARDAAQDAFALAFRHLAELRDANAFPAWFLRLVRTACERQRRGARVTAPLAEAPGGAADPASIAVARRGADRVRAAVEALPEAERTVVALHHLAGLAFPEVADFLGIGLSAAKKRAHVARRRLKELLSMTADDLSTGRAPSPVRDVVALFAAIRDRDRVTARELLARDPGLVSREEDWTPAEALVAGLPFAAHATPLVRAAGTGDVELVRLLLDAGADPEGACGCAGAETPVWAATAAGSAGVVAELLARGASPDAVAFRGATPLHVAIQRGRGDIAGLLRAAGAAEVADDGGRTPADWALVVREGESFVAPPGVLPTGIRALDLFAPLRVGSLHRWTASYGLGQAVVLIAVVRALRGLTCSMIGFEHDLVGAAEIEHGLAELGAAATVRLVPRGTEAAVARARFGRAVDEVVGSSGPRLVVVFEGRGHAHDVALALPRLRAAAPAVAATLVVEPSTGGVARAAGHPPDGYDGQVAFDPVRAARRLYPAIDRSRRWPAHTRARRMRSLRRAPGRC